MILENRFGLFVDDKKIIIETNCDEEVFEKVVKLVVDHAMYYNIEQVLDVIKSLGYEAEYLDDSTNKDFDF
jgi:anaerobic ribonucleoside-triphosphate reductase